MSYYLDIIVPIPLDQAFTYQCDVDDYDIAELGSRVIVQFGKNKYYTGVVVQKHRNKPDLYKAKKIEQLLDAKPIVNHLQIDFWKWIASYYMSSIGEVYKNALPSALILQSETKVCLSDYALENMEQNQMLANISDDEYLVIEALEAQQKLTLKEIGDIISKKNPLAIIKSLTEKSLVVPVEEIKNLIKPKKKNFISLHANYQNQEALNVLFEQLSKSKKQYEVLMRYLQDSNANYGEFVLSDFINKHNLSRSSVNSLVEKGVMAVEEKQVRRIKSYLDDLNPIKELSEDQNLAYEQIKNSFAQKDICLFHGVTSSGKTEIYIKLIEEQIARQKQVLFLIPEIALSSQLIRRLQKIFGDRVGVYHSKYNVNERAEVWNNVNENLGLHQVVLGPRSALFLPFSNLGLVIVDEEHEASFKQSEPAPRYNARDAAMVLAKLHSAKVLLGSATPSLESYYNCKNNKYAYVALNKRFGDIPLPDVTIADISKDQRAAKMKFHFGEMLYQGLSQTLDSKKQSILFQNRRGYAPVVECQVCGSSIECPNCDVTLTYHSKINQLRCHYCSYAIPMISACKACGSLQLDTKGLGTQQIEQELNQLFPEAKTKRLDHDAAKKKYAYQEIIEEFENGEIDLLVGTQMISKGLDFDDVALVGVMNADNLLKYPDFRAEERAYQLLSQVAGRSGRKGEKGKVIIQSYNPFHKILQQVSTHGYLEMAKEQLYERKNYNYPPYYRLIKLTLQHQDKVKVDSASANLAQAVKSISHALVLGPEYPYIARINNKYNKNILIKLQNNSNLNQSKRALKKILEEFSNVASYKSIRLIIDVDPY